MASSPQAQHRGQSGVGGIDEILADGFVDSLVGNKQVWYIQTMGKPATITGKREGLIMMVAYSKVMPMDVLALASRKKGRWSMGDMCDANGSGD
jgi:hypothetical protein